MSPATGLFSCLRIHVHKAATTHTLLFFECIQSAMQVSAAAAAMSPATGLFICLRSYPSNAGEAEGARRILAALLGRVSEAMHQVAKRLAGLKVGIWGKCMALFECFFVLLLVFVCLLLLRSGCLVRLGHPGHAAGTSGGGGAPGGQAARRTQVAACFGESDSCCRLCFDGCGAPSGQAAGRTQGNRKVYGLLACHVIALEEEEGLHGVHRRLRCNKHPKTKEGC
jgi:hypothetical protein